MVILGWIGIAICYYAIRFGIFAKKYEGRPLILEGWGSLIVLGIGLFLFWVGWFR